MGIHGTADTDVLQALIDDLPYLYGGLLISDPAMAADPLTVELVSPTYARVPAVVTISGVSLSAALTQSFYGIPSGTSLYGYGIFDAPVNGNLLFKVPYATPVRFIAGATGPNQATRPGGALLIAGFTLALPAGPAELLVAN